MKRKQYEKELRTLQTELCRLQEWVKLKGLKVIVVFEGRDAAGKGGTIKAITERVSPRVFRLVALPAPSDREKTQMYLQRYMQHFPAAGEVVIFDRSWYNRAGVERVMGFCSEGEYRRFLENCPVVEKYIIDGGIILVKFWLEVGKKELERRHLLSCSVWTPEVCDTSTVPDCHRALQNQPAGGASKPARCVHLFVTDSPTSWQGLSYSPAGA